jgi:hypothetical protein
VSTGWPCPKAGLDDSAAEAPAMASARHFERDNMLPVAGLKRKLLPPSHSTSSILGQKTPAWINPHGTVPFLFGASGRELRPAVDTLS